MPDTPR